jgi:hypothetical protein
MALRMPMRMGVLFQPVRYRNTEHISLCFAGEAITALWTRACDQP